MVRMRKGRNVTCLALLLLFFLPLLMRINNGQASKLFSFSFLSGHSPVLCGHNQAKNLISTLVVPLLFFILSLKVYS